MMAQGYKIEQMQAKLLGTQTENSGEESWTCVKNGAQSVLTPYFFPKVFKEMPHMLDILSMQETSDRLHISTDYVFDSSAVKIM